MRGRKSKLMVDRYKANAVKILSQNKTRKTHQQVELEMVGNCAALQFWPQLAK